MEAFVHVDAHDGSRDADRIGPVLENVRGPARPAAGQVESAARRLLLDGLGEPCLEIEDRVDGVGIVDMVGGGSRGVGGTRWLSVEHLPEEAAGSRVGGKDPALAEILVTDCGGEILPLRVLRIGGRVERMGPDVAEAARHADAIRPDEVRVGGVASVVVVTIGVPTFLGVPVKARVGIDAEAHDAGGSPVDLLVDTGGSVAHPLIQPQTVLVGLPSHAKAGLIDEPHLREAVRALP